MQYINKINSHKILFISILLGFIILLVGCNWFSLGLLNIIDPQAQIRVNYTSIDIGNGVITLEVYSLNEVEFIGWGFSYDYYIGTTLIPGLSKTVGATFYVEPSDTPGIPGPITTIESLPIYFKEAQDYMTANPSITEVNCTITLIGTDGSGHDITIPVTVDLPALQSGEPSSMTLQAAPSTVTEEDGTSTITATVKDAAGSPVPDDTAVSFSSTYGTLDPTYALTENGIATTTLTFSADDSSSTVTATSGSVRSTVAVIYSPASVAASTITLQAAPETVTAEEGTSLITATVTDSSGDPVPDGTGVSFSSTFGTISEITTTTNGIATATLTFSADDSSSTVTATCGSVSATRLVTYSPASGVPSAITLQASPVTLAALASSTITATITDSGGSPVPDGTAVTFSTTLGTLSSYSGTTTSGIASTILTHTLAGLVSVTATCGSVSEAVVVTFQ